LFGAKPVFGMGIVSSLHEHTTVVKYHVETSNAACVGRSSAARVASYVFWNARRNVILAL
jgi:hypothetical protein